MIDLAINMIEWSDKERLSEDHDLRVTAMEFKEAALGYSANPQTCDAKRLIDCWKRASQAWSRYTGMNRQTGTTSRQMLSAPRDSVFVWVNQNTTYPIALASVLKRDDLVIKPLSWLRVDNVRGRVSHGVVIDHAAELYPEARRALEMIEQQSDERRA